MSDEREPTREDQAREDQAHRAKLEHMLASMLDDPAMASLMVERLLPRLTEEAAARHLPEHAARDWIFGRMRKLALDWRGGDEAVLETAGMPAEPPVPRPPADPLSETVVRDEAPAHPPFRPPVDAAADVPVGAPVDASADTGSPAPSATDSGESVRSDAEDADDSVARAGPPIGDVSAVAPAPATPPERPSPSDATWTMSAPIHASSGAAASTDAPPAAPPAPSTPEDGVTAERLTAGFSSLRSPERPPDQPKVAASGETAAPTAAATTPAGERPKDDPAGAPVGWPDGRKSLPPNWSPRRPVLAPPERKGFEGWFEVMMLVVAAAALVLVWQARLIDFGGSERKDAPPMASVSAPGDPPSATAPVSAAANVEPAEGRAPAPEEVATPAERVEPSVAAPAPPATPGVAAALEVPRADVRADPAPAAAVSVEAPPVPLPETLIEPLTEPPAEPLPERLVAEEPPPPRALALRDILPPERPRAADDGAAPGTDAAVRPAAAAEAADVSVSAIGAATPAGQARVFIHYTEGDARAQRLAETVAERSRAAGVATVVLRAVPFAISRGNIRYFFDADRPVAESIAVALEDAWPVRDFTHYRPQPRPGTLEVWVEG